MDFAALDLPEPVMRGIREAGFVTATPIQEAVLPLALRGKDVAGQSQTGTGKTAAFLIAAFTRLLRSPAPQAPGGAGAPRVLIIAPTRELVVQIESDARLLGQFTPFRTLAVYGGIDYAKQREALAAGSSTTSSSASGRPSMSRSSSSTRPTECSTWGSSRTSGSSFAACRRTRSASRSSSLRRSRSGCSSSRGSS